MGLDDQLGVLLAQNAELFATYEVWANGQVMLIAGTIDDPDSYDAQGLKVGPLGYYPVVNVSGQTIYVPCVARIRADAVAGNGDALAATEALAQLTNYALDKRVRVDVAMGLASSAQAIARSNIGAVEASQIPVYSTRAAAQAMAIPASVVSFQISGHAAVGDGGDAIYNRVGSEPLHPGKLQDAAGAWFEQATGEFRPQQFGAFPGAADATTGIQAALDACAVLKGWVALTEGEWRAGDVAHPSGVEVSGAAESKTFIRRRAGGALTKGVWSFPIASRGSDIVLKELTLDGVGNVNEPLPVLNLGNVGDRITVLNVGVTNSMDRWAVRGDPLTPCNDLRLLIHCYECPAGGLMILPKARGNRNIDVSHSSFRRVGGNNLSIRDVDNPADGLGRWDWNIGVNLDFVKITDPLNTGQFGAIPVETWGCTDYTFRNFEIHGGTRGATAGAHMTNGVIGPGIITDQTSYAMEAGNCRNVAVRGIEVINCASIIQWTGGYTDSSGRVWNEVRGFLMEDVTLTGTPFTSWDASQGRDIVKTEVMNHYGTRLRRITIRDAQYVRSAFRLVVPEGSDITVDDPVIESRTPYSLNNAILPGGAGRVTVNRPRFRRTADMPADHYLPDATIFAVPSRAVSVAGAVAYIEASADMACSISAMTSGNISAFGNLGGTVPLAGLSIERGRAIGNFRGNSVLLNDSTGTARVEVDTSKVTSGALGLAAAIVDRRTKRTIEGTSAPTTGSWETGTVVKPSAPTTTGVIEWQCTAGGTPGIWVARYGAGSEQALGTSYAPLSALSSAPLLRASGSSSSNVMKIRCDVTTANAAQPEIGILIEWTGRNNQGARKGRVELAYGSFSLPTSAPVTASTSLDGINLATIVSALDTSGRMETTITFPVNGGVGIEIKGVARSGTNYASYSATFA